MTLKQVIGDFKIKEMVQACFLFWPWHGPRKMCVQTEDSPSLTPQAIIFVMVGPKFQPVSRAWTLEPKVLVWNHGLSL